VVGLVGARARLAAAMAERIDKPADGETPF
jgi:hypothetical protein